MQHFILSRTCIGLALTDALILAFTTPGGLLAGYSLGLRIAFHCTNVVIFLGLAYVILPRTFAFAVQRGWPLLWSLTGIIWLPAAAMAAAFARLDGQDAMGYFFYIASLSLSALITIFVVLLAFFVFALPQRGIRLSPAQIWSFHRVDPCKLQDLLTPEARGRVLRMLAENQYVRVFTDTGEDLIRIPLSDASELVPDDAGLRVHRSHWVAKDQIESLRFEGGNPRITVVDGTVLPISRKAVPDVREVVDQRPN